MKETPHPLSRRTFFRQACCAAVGRIGVLSSLAQLRAMGATAAATDYKALVCLFLQGGNDAGNVVIPYDNASYASYAQARAELALAQSTLLPIAPRTYRDGRNWALHPSVPEMQSLFAQGKLAILANVGTLNQPTTLSDYAAGTALPTQLFSHADQLLQWQTSVADDDVSTGWGGRLADIVNTFNSNPQVSMSISTNGTNTFQQGNLVSEFTVATFGINLLQLPVPGNAPGPGVAMANILGAPRSNLLQAAVGGETLKAQNDGTVLKQVLASAPALKTVFPSTNIGAQLSTIAQLISVAPALGLNRQIFFAELNGWDTHAAQLVSHGPLLAEISAALNSFYGATVEIGVANQVTTFTASDFGRTYIPNADGTDHGWGNHQFIMGGAVSGGDIFGSMPSLIINGPDDTGRGRWVPSTSVDEYSATLATWFGVSAADLPTVLPNIGRFSSTNLGFLG